MATEHTAMLSTVDNPYNPFEDFDKWYAYDISKGYNCCGIVSSISCTSRDLPQHIQTRDIAEAIERFVSVDPLGLYVKVVK